MAGKITALEVQKNNKERVNVYLNDEFAFGLSLIEAASLRKGQTLSDNDIAALKSRDTVEQAYERALRFLGTRPRSAAEVRRNLTDHEIATAVADEIIERLEGKGYLDDLAFAKFWVSNRQQFKPKGTRALRFELKEKGIADDIISEVLAEVDTSEAAYQAGKDKARRLHGLDKRAFRDKLAGYLLRRGFDYETVREVSDRLFSEISNGDADDDEPLQDDIEE
jgi:regulatory protein